MNQFKAQFGQKVKRKGTDEIIDVKKIQDIGEGKMGQFFSQDYEIYDPDKIKEISPPDFFTEGNYTGSSANLREKEKSDNIDIETGIQGMEDDEVIDYALSYDTDEINKLSGEVGEAEDEIQKLLDLEGELSSDDLSDIEEAGTAAGEQYNPLIREARQAKRSGLPKAVIAAGERGGFMSTQFAGIAALVPIEEGGFIGAGGKLDEIKTKYDSIISNLQTVKERAIAAAKSAAKQAKLTGKKEDTNRAITMYNLAKSKYQDALDMADRKLAFTERIKEIKRNQLRWKAEQKEMNAWDEDRETMIENNKYLVDKMWEDRQIGLEQDYGYRQIDDISNYSEDQYITIKNPITGEDVNYLRPKGKGDDFDLVQALREKDGGAGIDIEDDYETAWNKYVNGDIYKEEHKLTGKETNDIKEYLFAKKEGYKGLFTDWQKKGGGSGGSGAGAVKPFKFSSSQKTDMIGAGITNDEMSAIQTNLENGHSLNEILDASDFSEEEKNDITRVFTGEKEVEEEKSFIDDGYIKYQFESELWKDADKMFIEENYPLSKYDTLGWQSKKTKQKLQKADMDKAKKEWVEKEMQDIKSQVEKLRKQGFSDKEIDKMI